MLFKLDDVGAYLEQGGPDLQTWADDNVKMAAQEVLNEAEFKNVVLGFEDEKRAIREHFEGRAEEIGYSVLQFHTISALQADKLKDPFSVEVSGAYTTRTDGVQAGIVVDVRAAIPDPTPVASYLLRGADVVDEMRRAIRSDVATLMRGVTSFAAFFHMDGGPILDHDPKWGDRYQPGPDEPLEAVVKRVIEGTLKDTFGAQVYDISILPADSELKRLVDELHAGDVAIEIEIVPKGWTSSRRSGERVNGESASRSFGPIWYDATLIVEAVSPEHWTQLVDKRPTMAEIATEVRQVLKARYADVDPGKQLRSSNAALEASFKRVVEPALKRRYGVEVRLTNVRRRLTEVEAAHVALEESRLIEGAGLLSELQQAQINEARDQIQMRVAERKRVIDENERLHRLKIDRLGAGDADEIADIEKRQHQLALQNPFLSEATSDGIGGLLESPLEDEMGDTDGLFEDLP